MPGALNVAGADYWVERDAVRDHFPQKLRQHYATISYGIIVTTIIFCTQLYYVYIYIVYIYICIYLSNISLSSNML